MPSSPLASRTRWKPWSQKAHPLCPLVAPLLQVSLGVGDFPVTSLFPNYLPASLSPPFRGKAWNRACWAVDTAPTHQARCLALQGTFLPPPPHAFAGPGREPGCAYLGTQECSGGGEIPSLSSALLQLPAAFSAGLSSASRNLVRLLGLDLRERKTREPRQPMRSGLSPTFISRTFSQPRHLRTHNQPLRSPHCSGAPSCKLTLLKPAAPPVLVLVTYALRVPSWCRWVN